MTPAEFIAKWGPGGPAAALSERSGAQPYFMDLCALLGVPTPGSAGDYLFEQHALVLGEARGYADVFYRNRFAWENKAPGKNLDAALRQLQQYSLALGNPPLLVVCDRLIIRIHTQFNGHPSETHLIRLPDLADPAKQQLLRRVWLDPESFRPHQTTRTITEAAARSFATLAEQLRARGHGADQVAHFLTQCLFCFFAEDVALLPGRMFERLIDNRNRSSEQLTDGLRNLFQTMRAGGSFGADDIPWFNGGLFQHIDVPPLEPTAIAELRNAAQMNWSAIDVSIFGTLFERGLDPAKRSQLGAHYTDPATIARIIDPVITRPLLQQWERAAQELQALTAKIKRHGDAAYKKAHGRFIQWLETLRAFRILDPACGSGNFLFLGLKALKDVELLTITQAAGLGLDREQDLVTGPHNLLGIEINEYAAELARVSIWIGEIQWRMAHGYPPKTTPVLEPLEQIECRDALLAWPGEGADRRAAEAAWPQADVVVGNPPFLGGSKKRGELGSAYFDALSELFRPAVPGGADLVCYWFHKSLQQIQAGKLHAAGLVATQAIRAGSNRAVLDAITADTPIFDAWSDEPWVNDGAAVRVSLVCFGREAGQARLNGQPVQTIHADLTAGDGLNLTQAQPLPENTLTAFEGTKKYGDFDIAGSLARQWLNLPNPHGRSNAEVVKPWRNGQDLTKRPSDTWVIDFGTHCSEADAALFEAPFAHVVLHVKPERKDKKWWLHERPRPEMRTALKGLAAFITTVRVAKHRFFAFLDATVLPDTRLNVIARADDATFGILSSRIHEVWSLAQASIHGDGSDGGRPTYNAKSCFETYPFPAGLTPADTACQRTEAVEGGAQIPADLPPAVRPHARAIAQAAHRLDGLRRNWLNPPEWTQRVPEVVPLGMAASPYPDRIEPRPGLSEADAKALQKRTLTNLYNQRPAWLAQAHAALDAAVAAAYGWTDYAPSLPDEEILRRLLALNLQRTAPAGG